MSSKKPSNTKKTNGFFRPTISIPSELETFVEARKNDPQHAGNLSSYVRSLIIADRSEKEGAK